MGRRQLLNELVSPLLHKGCFGNFELEGGSRDCRPRHNAGDVFVKVGVAELPRREVHTDRKLWIASRVPLMQLSTGLLTHLPSDRDNKARIFGTRNKHPWRYQAPLRMPPAHQGFPADNLTPT